MPSVYLSAACADATLAGRLRDAISTRGVDCAADDHRMGDRAALPAALITILDAAAGLVVLASPAGCASPQVRAEVQHAIDRGHADAIAVITCGVDLTRCWPELAPFGSHPLPADPTAAELAAAAYRAVAAARIGEAQPGELLIDFDQFCVEGERACARVRVDGHIGRFAAPLGPIEAEALQWYLESYFRWPAEVFERRAAGIVDQLPGWGAALWHALLTAAGPALGDWLRAPHHARRLLTLRMATPRPVPLDRDTAERLLADGGGDARSRDIILARVAATAEGLAVDDRPPEVLAAHKAENEAQSKLLALPWELLASGGQYLCKKDPPVALRRVMVPREPLPPLKPRHGPIRVLVVLARPEKAGLIDPRASADALIDAVAPLGEAVELDFLRPPTVAGLSAALHARRYDVLHFDGHGVYDAATGLGYLCFEHRDPDKRAQGEAELVDGAELRDALGDKRLPLAFLEACQTGQSAETSDAAVASALLAAGAESVVAMSHSVLVTTAARFTAGFYAALIDGESVAQATALARRALARDINRGAGKDPAALKLHDFHVPLLYQRAADPVLVPGGTARLGTRGAALRAKRHRTLPDVRQTHGHGFVGRLRERLALERALESHRAAVIVGVGGQGKTTLAAELGRWLVRCERFRAAAFVSVEQSPELEGVLGRIGQALIGDGFVVEGTGAAAVARAQAAIGDWLERHPGLVIVDNFETLLPPPADAPAAEALTHRADLLAGMLDLMWDLCRRGDSRVIVTCREPLGDARFGHGRMTHVEALGGLGVASAVELVGEVCRNAGVAVDPADDGALEEMVRAVGCHPRALVLLPGELRHRGVRAVAADLHGLMAAMQAKCPGERQRSLLASVKLSLQRLPQRWRDVLPPLGLLRVGVSVPALCRLLEWTLPQVNALAAALAERGLVHLELGGNYLRFHPALTAVLENELQGDVSQAAITRLREQIVTIYCTLVDRLYSDWNGPEHALVVDLTIRELPNILRALDWLGDPPGRGPGDVARAIYLTTSLEGLLQNTAHRRALTGIALAREAWAAHLPDRPYSYLRHIASGAEIDRLVEAERLVEALAAAEACAAEAKRAAEMSAFPDASYCSAQALSRLGPLLGDLGDAGAALEALELAEGAFGLAAEEANAPARRDIALRMAAVCLQMSGDSLMTLGRYGVAVDRFLRASETFETLGNIRDAASARGQLAMGLMAQGDYDEALEAIHSARVAFERLPEPNQLANCWYQTGLIFEQAGRPGKSEDAYKNAIRLRLETGARLGAAQAMSQLANLALRGGRPRGAVALYRQALAVQLDVDHRGDESMTRSNLALALLPLEEFAEAEEQVLIAIEIAESLGVSAEPWKSWATLHAVAEACGAPHKVSEARKSAIRWYRLYREQGGMPEPQVLQPFKWAHEAVSLGGGAILADRIDADLAKGRFVEHDWPLLRTVSAFARGERDAVRAALDTLSYEHVVEFELLLAGRWPDPTAAP